MSLNPDYPGNPVICPLSCIFVLSGWRMCTMFVTFEGGEGAGKSTLIVKLVKELTNRGYQVVTTREPGGSALGEQIRQWLLNNNSKISIGQQAELLLFLAARAQHIEEVIRPALQQGKVVLCDRFCDSTIAYQGIARGLGKDYVESLCDLVCKEIVPNLTFFLDVDPEEGLSRRNRIHKGSFGNRDRIEAEKLEFHRKVRQGFQSLAHSHPDRIHVLNAHEPAGVVYSEAIKRIETLLVQG